MDRAYCIVLIGLGSCPLDQPARLPVDGRHGGNQTQSCRKTPTSGKHPGEWIYRGVGKPPNKETPSFRRKRVKRDFPSVVFIRISLAQECIKSVCVTPAADPRHARDVELWEKRTQIHPECSPWNVYGYSWISHTASLRIY